MKPAGSVFRLTAALLGTVLLLAACSPPDEGDDGGGGSGGEDGGPIRIGLLRPSTGDLAASGLDMEKGWNLYWETNGTEVAGREIETLAEDTAGDPAVALNKINQLTRGEGVDLVVGPLLANVGQAAADALGRQEVPLVMPIASADDLTQRTPQDYMVRLAGWTSSQTTHPYGQYVYDQGYERVLTICTDYAFGHENCGGFVNTFTDAGGEIVEQLWNPLGTPDFGSYIASIRDANPDAVFAAQVGADSVRFIQAWSEFGLKDTIPLFGNETLLDQSLLRQMEGDAPVGLVSVGHFADGRDAPGTQDFVDAYLEAEGEMPSYYAAAMNTAAGAIAQAVESLEGDVSDPDAVIEALRAVELGDDNPFGPLRVDEYGQSVFNVYVRQVEEGPNGPWNVPIEEFPEVSQFWEYDPEEFLEHPVYSRDYQGNGVWPDPLE
jgi:branched-chain amino acid transport system substrate-binding protein